MPKPRVKLAKAIGRVFPKLAYVLARYASDSFREKWSMIALKKQAEDDRDWSWYRRF